MKRKIIYGILTAVLLMTLVFSLASCDILFGDKDEGPALSGITMQDKTVTYDGEAHSLEISGTLPEGVTVEYTGNAQTNAGKYTVIAKFYENGELIEGADLEATLRINKASLSEAMSAVSFSGASFVYDGEAHNLEIAGTLPEGVTVSYEGNGKTEVGKYTVTAKFAVDLQNYYPIADMLATLTITAPVPVEPEVDLSGIELEGKTLTYDGEAHSLEITGTLPEGVTVEYVNNGKTDAGNYIVEAKFFYEGEELEGKSLRAALKIERAIADLSGISFDGKTVIFDGEAHSLKIEGTLPDYVTVSYVGNGQTVPGSYTVLAKFDAGKNYQAVEDMSATLTILSYTADLSAITLPQKTVKYDGEAHSLEILGTLPEDITVGYEGNGQIEVGTYTVTAKFYYKGVLIEGADVSASLKIEKADVDMSGIRFDDGEFYYDGEAHSLGITGTLPLGVTVSYEGNGQIAVGEYTVIAKFDVADKAHYNDVADMKAIMTITFDKSALSGITLTGAERPYDGEFFSIAIEGDLPEGVTVRYFNNVNKNAGTYPVTAKFYFNGEYIEGADLGATVIITKLTVDMSDVRFDGATVVRDGEEHSIEITGTLPAGVTVSYEGNGQSGAGSYTVTAKFTYVDEVNYNAIPDMTATLVIEPHPKDLFGVKLEDLTVKYNGSEHSILISGEPLAEGVTVEYVGNGQTAIGSYTVTAKFYYNGEYIEGADKSAILTVVIANEELAEIKFPTASFMYDGKPKSIEISGELPVGYTVEYVGNGESAPGTYTVTAKFSYNGEYNSDWDMTSSYTINSATLPKIEVSDLTVDFDGCAHEITYTPAALPEGVSVIRVGTAQYMPGTYTFTFRYSLSDEVKDQFEIGDDVTVTLTINACPDGFASEGLVFEAVTGGYAVVGYTGDAAAVIIPSTYEGKPVLAVSSLAFRDNKTMKSVLVPDSVTAIGAGAFRGTLLEEITVPFIGGSKTTSNKFFGHIFGASGYVANEYYVPVTLKRVVLSDACTYIPAYSFRGCISIEEIVIGSGVTEIGVSAFEKCTSLGSIYIPENVTSIPAAAYYYNSPFFDCGEGFTIYLEADAVPATGYGAEWNTLANGVKAEVVCGTTYEEYLSK